MITTISNYKVLSILRRNDRFLSLLNQVEADLIEKDKREHEKVNVRSNINLADRYTVAKLVDIMTDRLYQTEVIITGKVQTHDKDMAHEFECCYRVPKYSEEVAYVAQCAAFYEPARTITIFLSDLGVKILDEFQALDTKTQSHIISAVGRKLFKIYYPHYFSHIGDLIKVKAEA